MDGELGKEGWSGSLSSSIMTENQDFIIIIIIKVIIAIIIEKGTLALAEDVSAFIFQV